MSELPLLLFPSREIADRTKGNANFRKIVKPNFKRQVKRLSPIFQQLRDSFKARSVELQKKSTGIDPEQVLVFETVGNIENFANAAKKIPGLEWMGEVETEEIIPDDDFYDKNHPNKSLNGRLYLILTNQQALLELLSLWNQYKTGKTIFKRGLTKFRDVFIHLKNIRRWGIEDRLAESEVFEAWNEDLQDEFGKRNVKFEAELWYRKNETKRSESEEIVSELIKGLGGKVISSSVIPSIAYHSILGEIPAQKALEIIKQPEVDLIKCDNIMFLRPTGQISAGKISNEQDLSNKIGATRNLPNGDPIIAILDGLPLENHQLLAKRLIIDDPDDWASMYAAKNRQHGTAMASLIIHGDLNDENSPLKRPVYIRPIMKPNPNDFRDIKEECIPENILFVDYIRQAIKRMIEGEGENPPTAPSVKIVNFSIGDTARHFYQVMSPLARLLDWLSVKYNILFIISSGNHPTPISVGIEIKNFKNLSASEKESLVVKKIYENSRHRRLLSPGESINALTVGALHHDSSIDNFLENRIDLFKSLLPSPVSAFGFGYRRAIKPDLLFPGGKVLYKESLREKSLLEYFNSQRAPGNLVATPSTQVGELNKTRFCCGTSNSAALISRTASIYYDYLESIFTDQAPDINFSIFCVPILKAMLIHCCSWDDVGQNLMSIIYDKEDGRRKAKNWISRWIGYGIPDIEKVLGCNEQRATLIGFGQLKDGEANVYKLPLPPSLHTRREKRRLTITLAWLSPIASSTQRYRGAQLWFDFEGGRKSKEKLKEKLCVSGIDNSTPTRRGTIQHEIFEGEKGVSIPDNDILEIKINCRQDACKIKSPINYGLLVSLEVAEGVDLPIYNEIRSKIAVHPDPLFS